MIFKFNDEVITSEGVPTSITYINLNSIVYLTDMSTMSVNLSSGLTLMLTEKDYTRLLKKVNLSSLNSITKSSVKKVSSLDKEKSADLVSKLKRLLKCKRS